MKKNWEKVKLPEVVFFQEGPGLRKFQYTQEGIPFLNIRTLVNDRIDKSLCGHISEKEVNEKYLHFLLNEGDIICSTSGTIGKLAIVHNKDLPVMLNTSVIRFREIDPSKVFKRFIYYYLKSDLFLYQAKDAAKGQAQVNFGPSHLKKFDFILPPLPEQQRIVSILDTCFEAIEKAKSNAERNLQNAKELFESYLNGVFENKGEGWEECKLEDNIKLIDYRGRTPQKTESGVRLITAKNVKLGYLQLEPQEFIAGDNYESWMTRGIPKVGDVIFTTEAPLANVAQIESDEKLAFAQRIIVMQPNRKKLNPTFLKYMLLSEPIRKRILEKGTGATVVGIKSSLLKKISIYFPNAVEEQQTIVRQLDKLKTETQRLERVYKQKIDDLDELKKSVLQKAFSGELITDTIEIPS
jgi:type I restriction enzyme S subunit